MSRPYAEVYLEVGRPGEKAPAARQVRVIQAEYSHEVAVITYRFDAALRSSCQYGKPVKVKWGWPGNTAEFVGYVHHVSVDSKPERSETPRLMRVICVGATSVLNTPAFEQYADVRMDALISDLALRNRFSLLIEPHPQVWPLLAQEGVSTWSFLNACAKRIGWTIYARGTDVRCHSRAIRYRSAQLFRDYGVGATVSDDYAAIFAFDTVLAETLNTPARKRHRVAWGVDAHGVPFTVSSNLPTNVTGPRVKTPALTEYGATNARSISEAIATLAGEQEAARHHITAKATVSGDARVHAAGAVRLLGIDVDHDGFWFVTKVEHVVSYTSYRLNLDLGRDSLGDPAANKLLRTSTYVAPGDTAGRALAHDGRTTISYDRNSLSATYTATSRPAITGSASSPRWHAVPATVRVLEPVTRRPAVSSNAVAFAGLFGDGS